MNKESVRGEIARYMGSASQKDLVDGVKFLMANELRELDPAARVVETQHFNHSYVPDFVMNWDDKGPIKERQVFLRFDLTSVEMGGDVERLPPGSMFVGLQDNDAVSEDRSFEPFRETAEESAEESLLTDTSALAEFTAGAESPLLHVLRSNVVRGGRGVLDEASASQITDAVSSEWGDTAESKSQYLDLLTTVEEHFSPDAALRLKRSAQIIWMGTTGDLSPLDGEDGLALGQLSDVELQNLIPYVLSQPTAEGALGFWRHIGTMFDLERLFSIAPALVDVDITPLVSANTDRFLAKRARLDETVSKVADRGWRISADKLRLDSKYGQVQFASDARRIRPGGAENVPSWTSARRRFGTTTITSASMLGAGRRWTVESRDGQSVTGDCDSLDESTDETLFVPKLKLAIPSSTPEGAASVTIDFEHDVVDATPTASIGSLAELLLRSAIADDKTEPPLDLSEWTYSGS